MDPTLAPAPYLSIIIPALNEAEALTTTLPHLVANIGTGIACEILVCDGGSTDGTAAIAHTHGAQLLLAPRRGRAAQLNHGAENARGEVLYFLHADTLPPANFGHIIRRALAAGFRSGCFRLRFNVRHWVLRTSSWASRFNAPHFQFGDQSLFVQARLFRRLGPFNEQLLLMEDVEIVDRIKRLARFVVLPQSVVTSARKYLQHGVVRTEFTHLVVHTMYVLHLPQPAIARVYRRMLKKK
ncbi:TIGR04283 family arsenosugar biosynthesis glycosyltransferase [Hymenobacter sp. ASUV-10]|uniref:TIGR04283 family arsenosugar biosynthesis glycosyltransferase n=1 Tax=Hymenobacter aranciens TaxID=3063996 RepID=A0ABT9BG83_9BACT|nr:TIGR04283 family arsenosugar biosynthesis glycosyltransferase [Hymenobacter sp. ASUV-10]MDO7877278.1 TIGR04283 family arsenosugar biosynthesis glycosyltransferase [Hymenobacter sp. ASUV-10]